MNPMEFVEGFVFVRLGFWEPKHFMSSWFLTHFASFRWDFKRSSIAGAFLGSLLVVERWASDIRPAGKFVIETCAEV